MVFVPSVMETSIAIPHGGHDVINVADMHRMSQKNPA
jgi:hypothetical protein